MRDILLQVGIVICFLFVLFVFITAHESKEQEMTLKCTDNPDSWECQNYLADKQSRAIISAGALAGLR
jgi:hypothetical protein